MTPVHLRVVNRQTYTGEESHDLELVTEAQYAYKNGNHYLIYDETTLSGIDAAKTSLKIESDKVTIRRYGNQESLLCFEVGKRFITQYPTPHGQLKLELTTQSLAIDIHEGPKGSISIRYTMMMQSSIESRNEIAIEIF